MLAVGLTGGIGSGKSVVSEMFRSLGAHIIDADILAREALEPGMPAYLETVCLFGRRILGSDGRVQRKALADIVFKDSAKRALLEAVVHPWIFQEEARLVREITEREPGAVVVFDAALLIETGAHRRMDKVVVVWCSPEKQVRRLVGKTGLTPDEALLRIGAQMPLDEKKRHATHVVDNDGSLEHTRLQV